MVQSPASDSFLLFHAGGTLRVTLTLPAPRAGRAVLRTDLGGAAVRRREIIEANDLGTAPLEKAWHDAPLAETAPGVWSAEFALDEVGVFAGKCCFFPADGAAPEWPAGGNFRVKVLPAWTARGNAIYTVFTRQFGGARFRDPEREAGVAEAQNFLDSKGYHTIPPSGTFRDVKRALGHILDDMKFGIVQLLPPFPVPATYARMGRYGCPFAATDFLSVDPACAEFDPRATPLDQFVELVDAVHAKGARLFLDLPANHTGWAATLQTHHPDWYKREADGTFVSPGAWGVTWADLVELDYANPKLRAYMADVFLFWCRKGVDGFRCDAGYMIPEDVWTYIVARVRAEHPDTVFMLEGLGGELHVTDALLARAGLDWAYSEIFQTYDRGAFEWYLPGAIARAEKYGALVHFAETHDNDRLAKGGKTYARLRVQLAALLSHTGAWGIANGVEWFADEKIDVHGASALNWGAPDNLVALIARLNTILRERAAFGPGARERVVTRGDGNTLAVAREVDGEKVLVVANLDCAHGATVRWDAAAFGRGAAVELVTGLRAEVDAEKGVELEPGGVRAFWRGDEEAKRRGSEAGIEEAKRRGSEAGVWRFTYPEDLKRVVVVPGGEVLRVECEYGTRVRLAREDDVTVDAGERDLRMPAYAGDGTACDAYTLELVVFEPEGPVRRRARVLVPPRADRMTMKTVFTRADVRANPDLRTVLSDGAGASAFVPVAWGEIRSQYDALFAANPKVSVPGDRLVLLTRLRAWLQHEGMSREINKDCLESFEADPAGRFAVWNFRVPCGRGRVAALRFTYALDAARGNAARLEIARTACGADADGAVRVVARPDVEWRSFHGTTKAAGAVEEAFARAVRTLPDGRGFVFVPYDTAEQFTLQVTGGTYHAEPEWTYCVGHPDEAERGQEPCGDLYSPGWIACDFAGEGTAVMTAAYGRGDAQGDEASGFVEKENNHEAGGFVSLLRAALKLYVVRRDDVKTVIAGYPWFLDWGRDTFIFLRGAIAAGMTDDALKIVIAFARFEENGTLPNIIYGETAGNRDTVDAQLWFILAVRDLVEKVGDGILATDVGGRTLRDVLESIAEGYTRGTPNGIRVDAESQLVWCPSHFTWMDTNYPACTPRHGYPVEIQALWIAALRFLGGDWAARAETAARSLARYFPAADGFCDCLDAPHGERAADARPDAAVRPNQLFVLTLGALPAGDDAANAAHARSILRAAQRLITPGGVRSLAAGHPLYRGVYAGDEDTQRKPAYHNGTVWAWPFPLYAEALARTGEGSRDAALALLGSAADDLNKGCVCHLSETADGDAPHAQKGCRAQAWSDSELLRVLIYLTSNEQTSTEKEH